MSYPSESDSERIVFGSESTRVDPKNDNSKIDLENESDNSKIRLVDGNIFKAKLF